LEAISQRYGRRQTDLLLGHVAGILRNALRTADILFRSDNEEFVLLLAQTHFGTASDIASRMAENVRDEPWVLEDGQEMQVEIDVGVAVQPLDGLSWEEVLATARSRIGSHRVHTAETLRTIH
jgi:diguanylate cyclase (GGDEF)-like protein